MRVVAAALALGASVFVLGGFAGGDSTYAPRRIPVLSYHGLSTDSSVPNGAADARFFDVRLQAFREQMKYLHDAGFASITPEQYKKWVYGEKVSLPKKPVLITFDDGRQSAQLATRVLEQNGFKATMYVVTGFADGAFGGPRGEAGWYLNWDQLKAMRSTGVWNMQFHAGPRGHAYVRNPANPTCPYFYACRFGETAAAYKARVKSDVAEGLGAMRSVFGLPAGWRGPTFAMPWDRRSRATTERWAAPYFESQFPIVFVEDNYVGRAHNQRYRFEVHNPYDLNRFKAGLASSRFAR